MVRTDLDIYLSSRHREVHKWRINPYFFSMLSLCAIILSLIFVLIINIPNNPTPPINISEFSKGLGIGAFILFELFFAMIIKEEYTTLEHVEY